MILNLLLRYGETLQCVSKYCLLESIHKEYDIWKKQKSEHAKRVLLCKHPLTCFIYLHYHIKSFHIQLNYSNCNLPLNLLHWESDDESQEWNSEEMECVPPTHQPRHFGLIDENSKSPQQLSFSAAHCQHLNGESNLSKYKQARKWKIY
jgi:hypothetical protein